MKEHKLEIFIGTVLFTLLLAVCIFVAGGALLGQKQPEPVQTTVVTSEIIIEKINTEAFVVSKTVFLDQEKTLEIDQGSDWSNFWWGQTIDAEAIIRVDVGVDYSKITPKQISINNDAKTITIELPQAEILDASLNGDIQVKSTSGILKLLFANDTNGDYNLALSSLLEDARRVVSDDAELLEEARTDSAKVLSLVLGDLGYEIIISAPSGS